MRKLTLALVSALVLAVAVAVPPASAASPHFKKNGSPTCTVSSGGATSSTVCQATLAGLGNGDLVINVTVSGVAVYDCQNPGGNLAPGQNRVVTGPATTPTTIPDGEIKNGTVSFTTNPAVLTAPSTVSGDAAGCPNNSWTGVNPTLTVTNITMTIAQAGTLLFTCSASNPNGLTGTVSLNC